MADCFTMDISIVNKSRDDSCDSGFMNFAKIYVSLVNGLKK